MSIMTLLHPGNLTLDSTAEQAEVNDNLQVDGQTDLNGDINLGDATSEIITVTGRDSTGQFSSKWRYRRFGACLQEWNDLLYNCSR